jgi:hypothetical protein
MHKKQKDVQNFEGVPPSTAVECDRPMLPVARGPVSNTMKVKIQIVEISCRLQPTLKVSVKASTSEVLNGLRSRLSD